MEPDLALLKMRIGTVIILAVVIGCSKRSAMPATRPARSQTVSVTNPLRGQSGMADRLVMFDSQDAFRSGELRYVDIVSESPAKMVLRDTRERTYPRYGSWTSPQTATDFAFTELIPSWNVHTPPGTGVRFDVRTRDAASGEWSPWLYFGQWGRTLAKGERITTFEHGTVHVDNLVLERPASAYQVRATLESFDLNTNVNPSIRRIAISYSGKHSEQQVSTDEKQWARNLDVPFRAQGTAPRNLSGSICSPTSTSMVMAYWGIDRPIVENALAIYDDERDIFGNWNRAVQRAGEMGLDAWLTRVRNWDQAKAMIAAGQPIVAAINFRRGEFPSNPMQETDGHLIVIRGFTPGGDVICNDPASKDKGNGIVYKANELGKAWFDNAGGVAYVIRGEAQPLNATGTSSPR